MSGPLSSTIESGASGSVLSLNWTRGEGRDGADFRPSRRRLNSELPASTSATPPRIQAFGPFGFSATRSAATVAKMELPTSTQMRRGKEEFVAIRFFALPEDHGTRTKILSVGSPPDRNEEETRGSSVRAKAMKTKDLILFGLAWTVVACGPTEPSNLDPGDEPSDSLWPIPESPEDSSSAGDGNENPWLDGFGSAPSAPTGGSASVNPSGGAKSTPPPPATSEPPRKGPTSGSGGARSPEDPESPPGPRLILTRYEESTSSAKRLEVVNLGRAIELGECSLSIFSNGNAEPYRTLGLGALGESESLWLCTTQVADARCLVSLGASSFNGNDALVFTCGAEVVDSLGRVGEDPGRGWSDDSARTWDATLLRCDLSPDTDPSDPVLLASAWATGPFESDPSTLDQICVKSLGLGGGSSK